VTRLEITGEADSLGQQLAEGEPTKKGQEYFHVKNNPAPFFSINSIADVFFEVPVLLGPSLIKTLKQVLELDQHEIQSPCSNRHR